MQAKNNYIKYLIHNITLCLTKISPRLLFEKRFTRIVNMHNPSVEVLDGVLSALKMIAPFITYDELIEAIEEKKPLPSGFIISFDDGYRQNVALLDTLDKHHCKAIFFISTGPINSCKPLWFMGEKNLTRWLKKDLTRCDYSKFIEIISDLGLSRMKGIDRFWLNLNELKEIAARGHKIAVHTVNHPFLTKLTTGEIALEVLSAYNTLKSSLGNANLTFDFAYPDGDYNERVIATLQKIGVRSAVTIDHENINCHTDLLKIGRYGAADNDYAGYALFKQSIIYRLLFLDNKAFSNNLRNFINKLIYKKRL